MEHTIKKFYNVQENIGDLWWIIKTPNKHKTACHYF